MLDHVAIFKQLPMMSSVLEGRAKAGVWFQKHYIIQLINSAAGV